MSCIRTFVEKRSLYISIALFVLYFAVFFIPYVAPNDYWAGYDAFEDSAFHILTNICPPPENTLNIKELQVHSFAIIFVYIALWITQFVAVLVSKKHPYCFLASLIPFSVVFFGTAYMVGGWAKSSVPPSAGVFIMAAIYAFLLLVAVAWALPLIKRAIERFKSRPPREHKPTKAERIAELEARVRELENLEPENRD